MLYRYMDPLGQCLNLRVTCWDTNRKLPDFNGSIACIVQEEHQTLNEHA